MQNFLFLFFILFIVIHSIDVETQPSELVNQNKMNFGYHLIPKKSKQDKGGEDAAYASSSVLAVADGVSQWGDFGVDPAIYAKTLMNYVKELDEISNNNTILTDPKKVIQYAYERDTYNGSCTAMVITIDKSLPVIYTGQIGDAGFEIIRLVNQTWTVVEEYVQIQWQFNMPFQLCKDPNFGGNPDLGEYRSIKVENNDVILVATDGIWDNLFDSDILDMFTQMYPDGEIIDPRNLAEVIAHEAFRLSTDFSFLSPFTINARESGFLFQGGKEDDITAIIAQIKLV